MIQGVAFLSPPLSVHCPASSRTAMNRKELIGATFLVLALVAVAPMPARAQTPTLTNRTLDNAKVAATPTPMPAYGTGVADPALFPPDKRPKIIEREADLAYYVLLRHVSRVAISDAQGRTDDLFDGQHNDFLGFVAVHNVRSAHYEFLGSDAVYIIVPVRQKYSITFETNQPVMYFE